MEEMYGGYTGANLAGTSFLRKFHVSCDLRERLNLAWWSVHSVWVWWGRMWKDSLLYRGHRLAACRLNPFHRLDLFGLQCWKMWITCQHLKIRRYLIKIHAYFSPASIEKSDQAPLGLPGNSLLVWGDACPCAQGVHPPELGVFLLINTGTWICNHQEISAF